MDAVEKTVKASLSVSQNLRAIQQRLINGILRVVVVIGALAIVGASFRANAAGTIWPKVPIYLAVYAIVVLITF